MPENKLFSLTQCTLAELIDAGQFYLEQSPLVYGHGTDNAFDEAAWLALEACGISPAEPVDSYDIPVKPDHLKLAQRWFRQRATEKTPTAYITGRMWFCGLEFQVDERALIPRSPIAELIHNGFEPWLAEAPHRALDLCCGGGCIAIAMAAVFPDCHVDAVDLSQDALDLAAVNVAKHQLQNRVHLHHGNLFAPLNEKYNLIVSNPPYVDKADMNSLADEFHHEPRMGLEAGDDGLDLVDILLKEAPEYLTPDGVLIVEVGNSRPAAEKRFAHLDLLWLDFEFGGDGVFLVNAASLG